MMCSHQMSERQVLDAIVAEAIRDVFDEYVDRHGLEEIAEIFSRGVKIEVGDMLPSAPYAERLQARAASLGQGLRGERLGRPGGAGLVRRVRAGRTLQLGPDLPLAAPRPDRVRTVGRCRSMRRSRR